MEQCIGREGDVAGPGLMGSGASYSNRIIPRTAAPGGSGTSAGETTVIIHEKEEGEILQGSAAYLRSSGIVYRAMQLLEHWKYQPARISSSYILVDIIALKKSDALLIQVISSRKPVTDVRVLSSLYSEKIIHLRQMGTPAQFRKLVMVYSSRCGWKYYDVLPGGLIPAWNLPDTPEE